MIRNAPETLGALDDVQDLGAVVVAFFELGHMEVNKKTLKSVVLLND